MLKNTWKIVFAVWVFIWAFFLVRGFAKGELKEFREYALLNREEKVGHILGDKLHNLLSECKKTIPDNATYKIEGNLDDHNKYRLRYYLYPRLEDETPDYILDIDTGLSRYAVRKIR